MSASLLNPNSVYDTNLNALIDENVIASLTYEAGSRWRTLLLNFTSPLRLRVHIVELLLLTVAFGSESEAKRCWEHFLAYGLPLEDLDGSNYSIFPALAKRLAEIAPDDRYLGKLKGHYKYTWTKNQLKLKELAECITLLETNGIPCIISKDIGLSLIPHPDSEVRQINELTLLVRPENINRARTLLNKAGMRMRLIDCLHGKMEARAWRDPITVQVCGVHAVSLSAADLFLQHLLSVKFETGSQREWFADCLRVLSLFDSDMQIQQLRDRINSSCSVLDVWHAWCLFLRIAELTHCKVHDTAIFKDFATLHVSHKELLIRSGRRLRVVLSPSKVG